MDRLCTTLTHPIGQSAAPRCGSHHRRRGPSPPSTARFGVVAMFLLSMLAGAAQAGPNVVVLLADDLGWADVGYHGGPIDTPSIDRLAREVRNVRLVMVSPPVVRSA